MNKGSFYPRFAFTNIKNNRKFYVPYILTGIGTSAMFYIMMFLSLNKGVNDIPGSDAMRLFLALGTIIIGIFSAIFLLYTNNFLMKRRKKELGVFNMLGMEKKHIGYVQFFETLFVALVSIAGGVFAGILFSKLVMLLLFKIVHFTVSMGFEVSALGIVVTVAAFLGIYFLTFLLNLIKVGRTNPIELMREGSAGQREPKSKWLLAVIGILALGGGYAIAILVQSPVSAVFLFFIAVILVIIGTYSLFTAGSIVVLKMLRRNKKYYYKTKHFTSVSGMLYRMKQNAVGLANICILSTMVLVMVSTTVALYAGMEDVLATRYPHDIEVTVNGAGEGTEESVESQVKAAADSAGRTVNYFKSYEYLTFVTAQEGEEYLTVYGNDYSISDAHQLVFYTADEYEKLTGDTVSLEKNQVLEYSNRKGMDDSFTLMGEDYTVQKHLTEFPAEGEYSVYVVNTHYIVVADSTALDKIYNGQKEAYGNACSEITVNISMDLDGTDQEKIDLYTNLESTINGEKSTVKGEYNYIRIDCRQAGTDEAYGLYGGFLFLGVFLGVMFLMATILIIYYKQVTEGYEDRERFVIMQNVGMSRREVKKSIHSQILTVFFLPIIAACVHIGFAFNIIKKLLAVLSLTNVSLFVWCTIGTILVFIIFYTIVYSITAKVYYKIVSA